MALVVTKKVVVLIWCPEMNISKGKLPIFCWKTVSGVWISRRFEYYDLSHISCITLWNTWLNFNFDPNSSSCTYVLLVLIPGQVFIPFYMWQVLAPIRRVWSSHGWFIFTSRQNTQLGQIQEGCSGYPRPFYKWGIGSIVLGWILICRNWSIGGRRMLGHESIYSY